MNICRYITFIAIVVCLALVSFYPSTSQALDLELGGGLAATVVRVADKKTQDNVAESVSDLNRVPYFALAGAEYYPFEDYSVGLSWQFWGSTYSTYRQKVDSSYKDIDTKLSGSYFYALPILYYRLGDKGDENKKKYRFSIGLGYGLSYATIKGNVRLTEIDTNKPVEERKLEKVDMQEMYYSAGVFLRAEYKKLFFQVANYTPQVRQENYVYRISNVNWSIGYRFSIDLDLLFL